jgi:phage replisome organizer N-terminal domain protein
MAKTKIYFWLKIDKKFFDNIFIKRLKTVPGGYTMTVIYIRLMLESLESDCILYYEGYFDNLKEELALKLDVSEDDIDMTMAYFTKCGLIQVDEDKNAELPQAKALVQQGINKEVQRKKNGKS